MEHKACRTEKSLQNANTERWPTEGGKNSAHMLSFRYNSTISGQRLGKIQCSGYVNFLIEFKIIR